MIGARTTRPAAERHVCLSGAGRNDLPWRSSPRHKQEHCVTLNSTHRYTNTAVLSIERVEAPVVVTSAELDERLADVYARTKMRGGMLEGVVGIHERRRWAEGQSFTEGAVAAGRAALGASGVDSAEVGLLINTSLSREWLEPSTAVFIHDALGMPPSCQNFDVTNACLGFVNGIEIAAAMIDAGAVDYALVVDARTRHRCRRRPSPGSPRRATPRAT